MMRWLPGSFLGRTLLLVYAALFTLALSYLLAFRGLLLAGSGAYLGELAALRFERAAAQLPAIAQDSWQSATRPAESPASHLLRRGIVLRQFEESVRAELSDASGPANFDLVVDLGTERIWIAAPQSEGLWLGQSMSFPVKSAVMRMVLALLVAFLATAALAALFASRMTRPLVRLADWARAGGSSPVPAIARAASTRETRQLGAALATMREQLATADREREIVLAGVSHDIRTPLARLRLRIEMLNTPSDQARELEHELDEIDGIVEQFIAYARSSEHEPVESVSVDALVRELTKDYPDVPVTLGAPNPVRLRRHAFMRSLRNLLINAARHGKPPFEVHTFRSSDEVVVAVRDYGGGIVAADRARALAPFSRLMAGPTQPGCGLGLAIVQRLMQADGGRVVFDDADGAYFEVQLRWPT